MTSTEHTEAFLTVLEAHKGILYKISHAYCREVDSRDDLVQEIIVHLWKAFEGYDSRYRYSTWIYRIALNVAISYYRKERTRKKIALPVLETTPLPVVAPDENGQKEQQLLLLQQFIAALPDMDKALMLLFLDEKSQQEMSEILGISVSNVSTRIHRVKNKLKEQLSTI
ncbi:RNA polymerase sigma-70 factor, ECF subfamily [Filimonas lacunae]|uniref:RNA polymerase sigma-70 factor, ECF subfamily n=1 Tax=Filimonas lacunae TaxID=477680 RepID=A0A173M982_9BACT|nr:RNA polymerase sigma factor [Filimonas lacunae]BAV04079.1 RNA polymerase ECF-type sigma factor [Filimonas lacunae]SIT15680.1 RNA polymerase sigma-70 factor, ECF subfamily [Filimonas lacunae]